MKDVNIAKAFFDSLTKGNNVSLFAGGLKSPIELPELEEARIARCENPNDFLKEYRNAVSSLNALTNIDTLNTASALLKLIHVNVELILDSESLSDLLIALSNKIQELNTTYKNRKYAEGVWGGLAAYKLTRKVDDILTYRTDEAERALTRNYVIDTISQIPITNTVLAGWKYFVFKQCGLRIEKEVSQVVKVLYLYDRLVGCGVKDLLIKSTQEKAAKKLKPLCDVGLQDVADKILGFYLCRTENEKKRFLTDIEEFINGVDITERLNDFLRNISR